ncbi:MAG: hypothetical protein HDS68_01165 [Bacteroidales bacterium]|nr:hypothetical protein [Bacteroidales bacterium]
MKFNKIFLGLGVMGFALASCSDDVEYTPAEPVNTPPVYFSMNDEPQIDLEEDATYFTMKVYRQNASAAGTGNITVKLSADDGTDPSSIFTIGQVVVMDADDLDGNVVKLSDILDENDQATGKVNAFIPADDSQQFVAGTDGKSSADVTVNFPAGSGEYDIAVYFGNVGNLVQLLNYNFDAVAAGEASPYYITSVNYDVSYTPWETIDEGPVMLRDYTILAPSTAGREIEFEVTCQKHPIKKDFFRLIRPYADCGYGDYVLNMNDPNYLYINAANASEVFFSDKTGNYQKIYDTGIELYNGVDGTIKIACNYCYNKLEENLEWEGLTIPFANLSGAGEYENGRISFGSNLTVLLPGIEGYWSSKSWTLVFPWASSEWEEIGIGEYTDGFITQFYSNTSSIKVYPTPYPVTVERHLEEPGLYRMVAPYAFGVWPSEFATPWDMTFNVVINCEDPDFVIVEHQTAFEDSDGAVDIMNAAFAFMNYLETPSTKDQIIADGENDIFDEETGTITIAHPFIYDGTNFIYLPEQTRKWNTPAKLVLPTEEEEAGDADKAPRAGDVRKIDFSTARR